MLIQSNYEAIRSQIHVGDGLAFGGEGFVSDMIKWWTRSQVSHWATVLEVEETRSTMSSIGLNAVQVDQMTKRRVKLIESTTLANVSGVQINYASERIAGYDGRVWWLPLSFESRRKLDVRRFTEFLLSTVGRPYDKLLIVHLFFDRLNLIPAKEDWNAMICSEEGAAGYKLGELLPANLDTAEVTPQRMCEYALWADEYSQLKGTPKEIRRFNTGLVW